MMMSLISIQTLGRF